MSSKGKKNSKKGRRRKNSNYDMDSDDDGHETLSIASGATLESNVALTPGLMSEEEHDEDTVEEQFKDCLESLSEKRATVRENGLKGLRKLLQEQYFDAEFLEDRQETLIEALVRSVRRGKPTEQVLALNTTCAAFAQLGDGSREPLFNDISGTLQTTVRDHTASTATRAAAVEALSFTCFISCRDDDKVVHNMGLLEHEMDAHIADLCVAALGGWSLMITQLAPRRAAASFERMAEVLDKLMGAPDVDVRIGASEALAVMVEQCRAADEAFDDGARDALDGLVEQLALLSTDSDRRRAKKDRSRQRAEVRGVLRYMEGGEGTSEKLKVAGQTVDIIGYAEIVQLEFLRDILATGIQTHLMLNMTVRAIFGLGPPSVTATLRPGERSAAHKHQQALYAPQKKNRSQGRASARAHKHSAYDGGYYD